MHRYTAALIVVFLLLLPHLLLFPATFGTQALLFEDHLSFFYPFRSAAARMYRDGRIALWDPYIFAGLPGGAEIQTALFYPFNLLFLPLSIFRAIAHFAALHLFLASLFMYLYLRGLGISRGSSLFGACVFGYNGFSIVHTEQLSIISSCAWLPLILLLVQRASERRGLAYPTFAGIAVGLQFLAGHPQMALIGLCTAGAYLLFLLRGPALAGNRAELARRVRIGAAVVALGTALAAVALLPFAEAYRHSLRATAGAPGTAGLSLSPRRLPALLVPALAPGEGELDEVTGGIYAGAVPFLLALLAATGARTGLAAFYGILAVFSLLAALGEATPLHRLLAAVPPLRPALQLPLRFFLPYMTALSVLSALALDRAAGTPPASRLAPRPGGAVCAAFLAFFGLALAACALRGHGPGPSAGGAVRGICAFLLPLAACLACLRLRAGGAVGPRPLKALLLVLALADLLSFGRGYLRFGDAAAAGAKPPVFDFFERDPGLYRVSILDRRIGLNLPMVYSLQNIGGYSPAILADTLRYLIYNATGSHDLGGIQPTSRFFLLPDLDTKMSGLMNVKYHVAPFRRDGAVWMQVSARRHFYPRAFIVPRFALVPERARILEILGDEGFDPAATVLLESAEGLEGFDFSPATRGSARVARYTPDCIDIETVADGDSFLFVSEIFFPGWKVSVDGAPGAIHRAHYLFRAVPLKKGAHRVRFSYAPASFAAGACTSLAATALAAGLLLCALLRSVRRGPDAATGRVMPGTAPSPGRGTGGSPP
ncbi:MAG: YfhO family protein [Candidatus Aureabacteria bacterium]|nr:YfhO family protein [Candidatus Auribacterota bacterium]NLW93790.1 YfhO family protein [Chlamydiota bacterium]HOE26795.1 YfhO family protein [bacterium]HQM52358.1 YfhO family protein [bacterium]